MERVIVLNCDYTFINTVSLKKAIKYIVSDKVEVVKSAPDLFKNSEGTVCIKIPLIVRLIKMIRSIYKSRVPYSKRNIFVRDNYVCQYCSKKLKTNLSVDHIIPSSRGGKTNFENCVTACKPCNNKKDNKTPREAGMTLKRIPVQPTIMEFLRKKMKQFNIDEILNDLMNGV